MNANKEKVNLSENKDFNLSEFQFKKINKTGHFESVFLFTVL
jgi:hypothetical protein